MTQPVQCANRQQDLRAPPSPSKLKIIHLFLNPALKNTFPCNLLWEKIIFLRFKSKECRKNRTQDEVQLVERLSNIHEVLCVIPSTHSLRKKAKKIYFFCLFNFWFFDTGFLCVPLAVQELSLLTRLASIELKRSACFCFLSAGINGVPLPGYEWDF